jgi:predicted metal-dependent peptidase
MSAQQAEEVLSRSIIKIMMDEPFYAHFLGQVSRIITHEVTTAAVGIRNDTICLFVNADFFLNSLESNEERVAILKHEVLHLVFYHLYRFIGEKSSNNALINNLAADLVVNQFVDPWPLPEGAILLDTFPQLKLEPEESVEYYYDKLIEAKEACDKKIEDLLQQIENCVQGGDKESQKGEGKSHEKLKQEIEEWQRTKNILDGQQDSGLWTDDHSKWSDNPMDEISRQQIDNVVTKSKDRMRPQDWNGAPGWLKDHIDEMEARRKPKVDWRRTLRIFACNACRTKIKGTMKKYSKRFGAPNPGIRIQKFQKIVAIVDTSGSMVSKEVVSSLFAEIHAIWKAGAQVHIVECDTVVHRAYDYQGLIPEFVEGGGGNDCDPAFEYLWEYRKKGLIDGCLFLTDGWFDKPTIKPPCKLLWVLTPNDSTEQYLDFGSFVRLD